MERGVVIYVAPDSSMRGGMATVSRVLAEAGLFSHQTASGTWPSVEFHASLFPGSRLSRLKSTLSQLWHFARRRDRKAIVHLNAASGVSFLRKAIYILLAERKGWAIVLQIHPERFIDFYANATRASRFLVRSIMRRAHRVVALTERVREFVESEVGVPCVVVPNPVLVPNDRSQARADSLVPTLLFVGGYTEAKGVHTLLNSAQRLHIAGFRFHVKMFGDGAANEVRSRVEEAGLSSVVKVDGWIGPVAVSQQMASADMLVLPSSTEGLPMAVLEAMAHGLPVVASDVGALPTLIQNQVNGILVPPRDAERLATAIAKLLTDRGLSLKMGEANRVKAAEFRPDRVVATLRTIYESAWQIRSSGKCA